MKLLDFRKREASYNDDYAGRGVRTATFQGHCALCGTRTYAFADGGNDPRGPLGDHAAAPMVANDYGMTGPDVPACFTCQNTDETRYSRLLGIAKSRWYTPADPDAKGAVDLSRSCWDIVENGLTPEQ